MRPYPKSLSYPKKARKFLKRTPLKRGKVYLKRTAIGRTVIKKKPRKPTGELPLFIKIYVELGGICQVTKKWIPFDVWSFMHILSKGAYESLRLKKKNILMVDKRIHDLYDNSSKEKLLKEFPEAIIIYELKQKLKQEYYKNIKNGKTI